MSTSRPEPMLETLAFPPRHFSEFMTLAAVLVPPTLVVLLLIFGMWREHASGVDLHAVVAKLRAEGQPVDLVSLMQDYDQRTSRQHTAAWTSAIRAGKRFGHDPSLREDVPSDPRDFDYLTQRNQILVEIITSIPIEKKPVWFPESLLTDWGSTEADQAHRLLRTFGAQLSADFYRGNYDKCVEQLEEFELAGQSLEFTNWSYNESMDDVWLSWIREFVQHGVWTAEQLERMSQVVSRPTHYEARWQRCVEESQAKLLTYVAATVPSLRYSSWRSDPLGSTFGLSRVHALSQVRSLEKMASVEHPGTFAHVGAVGRLGLDRKHRGETELSFVAVPFAYAEDVWSRFDNPLGRYAQALMVAEVRRRWTRAAIGLRQYRLQQGNWPARLSDLATVGVSATDIEVQPGYPMGYRVVDDVAELWLPRLDSRGDFYQRLGDTPHSGDRRLDYQIEDRLLELR